MISRICIALILGALGFVTGALATWMLSDLPGVTIPNVVPLWVGCGVGLVCVAGGFLYTDKTLDVLGEIWNVAWQLSLGIYATLRALIR